MSEKINQIVEELKTLTLLEASELVSAIEETFGVDASAASAGPIMMATAAPVEEVEEKTEFDAILLSAGDKKIGVIKVIREITGLGLKEAKDLVEKTPSTIKEACPKDEAEKIKAQIEEAGGQVDLK